MQLNQQYYEEESSGEFYEILLLAPLNVDHPSIYIPPHLETFSKYLFILLLQTLPSINIYDFLDNPQ
jgi:hypothetical protein